MSEKIALIKKADEELQIAYAEVYVPNVPDTDREFMTSVEVRKMAHKWMMKAQVDKVDTGHDNSKNGCFIVESFIARKGDPDFIEDSWVCGVFVPDSEMWEKVKKGELNGFSMEALVTKIPRELEIEIPEEITGETCVAEGHCHVFKVNYDADGNLVGGRTDEVDGHFHEIRRGTITENSRDHSHRFSFVEFLT